MFILTSIIIFFVKKIHLDTIQTTLPKNNEVIKNPFEMLKNKKKLQKIPNFDKQYEYVGFISTKNNIFCAIDKKVIQKIKKRSFFKFLESFKLFCEKKFCWFISKYNLMFYKKKYFISFRVVCEKY